LALKLKTAICVQYSNMKVKYLNNPPKYECSLVVNVKIWLKFDFDCAEIDYNEFPNIQNIENLRESLEEYCTD